MSEYKSSTPSAFVKKALAQAVIRAFPFLEDPAGQTGYEAWFSQGTNGRLGRGRIEARLKYVRNALSKDDKRKIHLERRHIRNQQRNKG